MIYSAFEIDKPHRHNQNLVGTFLGTSLLWSTKMKTAVIDISRKEGVENKNLQQKSIQNLQDFAHAILREG